MVRRSAFQAYSRRIILICTVVTLLLANQGIRWPSTVYAQRGLSAHQHSAQTALRQKGTLGASSAESQPIIFVHGINENAHQMGKREFAPLYASLQPIAGSVQTFYYVDDLAYADGTDSTQSCPPKYTPCISQSAVLDNAIKLAAMISTLAQKSQHQVTLIGYSMGAAIIRTALSGCQSNVTCQAVLGSNIASMVNNVFFIAGVQQGSWMMQSKKGGITPAAVAFLRQFIQPLFKLFWGSVVNANAEKDLAPQSINVVSHNSILPAKNIHYYNFYGNIVLALKVPNLFSTSVIPISIGDGVVLPGTDNPQETPFWGGARYCLQCNGQNAAQIDANTTYTQWPLTVEKTIDLANQCTPLSVIQHDCVLSSLFDLITNTPQFHTNMPSAAALDGTAIQVADTTGISASKMTGISQEIALQLQVMPPTQTMCPTPGTARAAVTAPLVLGAHSNVVYIVNEFQGNTPTFGILKRYDVVAGKKTEIIKLPGNSITSALLSANGTWLLYVAQRSGLSALQMIRVDGHGLQTLYCTSADNIGYLSWSPDRKYALFTGKSAASTGLGNGNSVYLLDTFSGEFQEELVPQNNNYIGTFPSKWLDATHAYILSYPPNTADTTANLYLLNVGDGPRQQVESLHAVLIADGGALPPYLDVGSDFDISPDGTHLYMTQCTCGPQSFSGPSSITVRPSSGGTQQTIATASMAVTSLRTISNTSLLLLVNNFGSTIDTSQNGLWKINTNGTGLTQLMVNPIGFQPSFAETQYPWSVVSRDGSMYVLQSSNNSPYTLLFGSMKGGPPTIFASISDGTKLSLLGWTTMS